MKATDNYFIVHGGNSVFQDFNEAGYLYGEYLNSVMEKIGMRYSYRYILRPIMENESLTQLELSEMTGLKAPTISITLRNMERDGIVFREKKGGDMRETHVSITEEGKKLYSKVVSTIKKAERAILKGIDKSELNAMSATIEKMLKNLQTAKK